VTGADWGDLKRAGVRDFTRVRTGIDSARIELDKAYPSGGPQDRVTPDTIVVKSADGRDQFPQQVLWVERFDSEGKLAGRQIVDGLTGKPYPDDTAWALGRQFGVALRWKGGVASEVPGMVGAYHINDPDKRPHAKPWFSTSGKINEQWAGTWHPWDAVGGAGLEQIFRNENLKRELETLTRQHLCRNRAFAF
jgi:hypothetical protein